MEVDGGIEEEGVKEEMMILGLYLVHILDAKKKVCRYGSEGGVHDALFSVYMSLSSVLPLDLRFLSSPVSQESPYCHLYLGRSVAEMSTEVIPVDRLRLLDLLPISSGR